MNKALVTGVVVVALIAAASFVYVLVPKSVKDAGYKSFVAEKHGRIVDAETKAGIPNVRIVAAWHSARYGWKTSYGCEALRVVTTDADGNFLIPDVSDSVELSQTPLEKIAGADITFAWRLSIFKPGYVRLGDLGVVRAAADQQYAPRFAWPSMESQLKEGSDDLEPIYMQRTVLSTSESLVYDDALLKSIFCGGGVYKSNPDLAALQRDVRAQHEGAPCEMPRSAPLSHNFLSAYSHTMRYSEVRGAGGHASPTPSWVREIAKTAGQDWENASVTAGMLCDALKTTKDDHGNP